MTRRMLLLRIPDRGAAPVIRSRVATPRSPIDLSQSLSQYVLVDSSPSAASGQLPINHDGRHTADAVLGCAAGHIVSRFTPPCRAKRPIVSSSFAFFASSLSVNPVPTYRVKNKIEKEI